MAANKKATKSGAASRSKKKASAAEHARAQAQGHMAEAPPRGSNKEVDQSRFPGEVPLTGEDRPTDRPGAKQRGYTQDLKPIGRGGRPRGSSRAPGDRTPENPGEMSLRRGRHKKKPPARHHD